MNPTSRPRSGSQLSGSGIPPNANNISRTNSQISLSGNVVNSNNRSRSNSQLTGARNMTSAANSPYNSPQLSHATVSTNPANLPQSVPRRGRLSLLYGSTQVAQTGATPSSTNHIPGDFYVPREGDEVAVSQEVTTCEYEILQAQQSQNLAVDLSTLSVSDKATQPQAHYTFPIRPAYGQQGKAIELWTNHLQIHFGKGRQIFRYEVNMTPRLEAKTRKRKRFFALLCELLNEEGPAVATDYASYLFTTKLLNMGPQARMQRDVPYFEPESPKRVLSSYRATIRLNRSFSLDGLLNDLRKADVTYPDKTETVQALNVLLSDPLTKDPDIRQVGNGKHFPLLGPWSGSWKLGAGVEARMGLFASARTSTFRTLLNLNPSAGAFYKPGPLKGLIGEFESETHTGSPHELLSRLGSFLYKVQVRTNYLKKDGDAVPQVKTIRRVPSPSLNSPHATVSNTKFSWTNPETNAVEHISVLQYFATAYKITLQDPNGRVVDCGMSQNILIPVELCTVPPGQPFRDSLTPLQTAEMIKVACNPPEVNARRITTAGTQLLGIGDISDGPLRRFGIDVDSELLKIPGRVIPPPTLVYGGGSKKQIRTPGMWNVSDVKFHTPVKIRRWDYLMLEETGTRSLGDRDGKPITYKTFVDGLGSLMVQYGILVHPDGSPNNGKLIKITYDSKENLTTLKSAFNAAKTLTPPIELLVVFLPSNDNRLRSMIKYIGDCMIGVPTICIVPKKGRQNRRFLDTSPQFLANNLLKINAKLGGVNHLLDSQGSKVLKDTMFCGLDVAHPGTNTVENCPSIAGLVANTTSACAQWPASVRAQTGRQEMVPAVGSMLRERLKVWRSKNRNALPSKIIVYRDGVSVGQYAAVIQQELPEIRKAVKEEYGTNLPKLALSITTKRHNQRFYCTQGTPSLLQDSRTGNCRAGTVIDRGVTTEKFWSFYLQPHNALQGTARSVRYDVLLDEIGLGGDEIQLMTNQLSYLFARATRATSLSPPAFYAHLVAERGAEYLYPEFHPKTKNEPAFDMLNSRWTGGVHQDMAQTMFYL